MSEFETANFFADRSIQDDPYPYFDWVRGTVSGLARAELRPLHHHGPPRGHGRLR